MDEKRVLCAANSYLEKFYFNERFRNLPEDVKQRLQMICVAFTEEIGGIFLMRFSAEGKLELQSIQEEGDYLYDEIGSGLKAREISKEYEELFQKLELYYEGMQRIQEAEEKTGRRL